MRWEGYWGYCDLHPHLDLTAVNLDSPQGPKYLSKVESFIAEKEEMILKLVQADSRIA